MHHLKIQPRDTREEIERAVKAATGKRYCTACQTHRPAEQFRHNESRYCEACSAARDRYGKGNGKPAKGGALSRQRLYRVEGKGVPFVAIVARCPGVAESTLRQRLQGRQKLGTWAELQTGKRAK